MIYAVVEWSLRNISFRRRWKKERFVIIKSVDHIFYIWCSCVKVCSTQHTSTLSQTSFNRKNNVFVKSLCRVSCRLRCFIFLRETSSWNLLIEMIQCDCSFPVMRIEMSSEWNTKSIRSSFSKSGRDIRALQLGAQHKKRFDSYVKTNRWSPWIDKFWNNLSSYI